MASRKFKPSLPPQYSELATLLSSDAPFDQKLSSLQKEFQVLLTTNRKFEKQICEAEKRCSDLTTQKENIQSQLTKSVLAKSTLEGLCRELQKHSKAVSEDTRLKVTEEKIARKEVAAQFQSQIDEITSQMHEQNQRNLKLEHDNAEMKLIIEQFDVREDSIRKLFEKKEIEIKLAEAKAAQYEILLEQQKETSNTERDIMMLQVNEKHKMYEETILKEIEMRAEIEFYSAKFQEVQETMSKSGDAFEMLKKELDKKDKIIKRLDNDRDRLIKKLESIDSAWRDQRERSADNKKELRRLTNKNTTLEGLCRALQEERTQLKRKISSLEENKPDSVVVEKVTPKSKLKEETESESKNGIETESKNGIESENKDGIETETECKAGIESESKDEIETETESKDEIETETESKNDIETESNCLDQSTDSDSASTLSSCSKGSPVKLEPDLFKLELKPRGEGADSSEL